MTLQERINEMDDSTVIYIGATTSFVFIGTKAEYERDIDSISKNYHDSMVREIERINNDKKQFAEAMKRIKKISSLTDNKADVDEVVRLTFALNEIGKRLQYGLKRLTKLQFYLENFKPVRERAIKREYNRIQGDGYVIIIDGFEAGKFWFYEEYKKGEAHDDDSTECDSAS